MPNDDLRKPACRNCSSFRRCFPEYASEPERRHASRRRAVLDQNAFGAFRSERELKEYLPERE
ncbi:MAG TPA: hypothetical protein VD838_23120 [Anaeromyxobacteraceae bacterium]|nr:hypothetical protein [Anaeromyxobacteraceae bacterium]